MKKLMDKCTIIRLIESGSSQRSVAKKLTMNCRRVAQILGGISSSKGTGFT